MARFDKGWIKIHRRIEKNWIAKDGFALAIFAKLLLWANTGHSQAKHAGKIKEVMPGQVVTSGLELAQALGFERKTVEQRLKLLEQSGTIGQQKSNAGRIITIRNWIDYQKNAKEAGQQKDNDTDNGGDNGGDNGVPHIKEGKKKRRKEVSAEKKFEVLSSDLKLADDWKTLALERRAECANEPAEYFAKNIAITRTEMGFTGEEMEITFHGLRKLPFWTQRLSDPSQLLKKDRDGLRKIDHLIADIEASLQKQQRRAR